jgi:hypothetical protein
MMCEFLVGESFHLLAASAAFYVPIFNVFLRYIGARSIKRDSFKSTLLEGRSVSIIPGGISEMFVPHSNKDEVRGRVRTAIVR